MRVKWPILAAVLGLGVGYFAYPYITLLRLGLAVQTADAATLQTLVDWPAVREGIKEDVCDYGAIATAQKASDSLPPFGASFVRGIATSAIDQAVTPQALVQAVGSAPTRRTHAHTASPGLHVEWAFFDSPTTFDVDLRTANQVDPIRVELELRDGVWQVRRVWLPHAMLSGDAART